MHLFKILFAVVIIFCSSGLQAQSLLKAIPAPHQVRTFRSIAPAAADADSTFTGFRFVGPSVLYALPNSTIFTGAGIAYEHDTYRSATGKWYTDWSVNLEGYAGGQFAPKDVSGVTAVGLSVSFFNKVLTVGILYNLTTNKVAAGIGPTVSLNN